MPSKTHRFHHGEPHTKSVDQRLNWLRAGVLGANDGIVSTAGVVIGVAGATSNSLTIATAGIAALVAGAFSMAGGEYVSVSTQRDTERAALDTERRKLKTSPGAELKELTDAYIDRGVTPHVAALVARDLSNHDALRAHANTDLSIDPSNLTNPWLAAFSSLISFTAGAIIPLAAILIPLPNTAWVCVGAVAVALGLTGFVSARFGRAHPAPAIARNVGMGLLTMAITYAVGHLFGTAFGT